MTQHVTAAAHSAGTAGQANEIPHVLAHSPKDNVAVVVIEGLKAGTSPV